MSPSTTSHSDIKLLPWLINGTLSRDERERVLHTLREHEAVRKELGETLDAFALFGRHPRTEILVDLAFGTPVEDAEEVEVHLAHCPDCAAQLDLARRSAERRKSAIRIWRPAPVAGWWQHAAIAATLACLVVGGFLVQSLGSRTAFDPAVGGQAPIVAQQETRRAPTAVQLIALQVPVVTRSKEALPEITMPADPAQPVVLALESQSLTPDPGPFTLQLHDKTGALVFTLGALQRNRHGEYTFLLPADNLPPGTYSAQILRHGEEGAAPLERYDFRVVP